MTPIPTDTVRDFYDKLSGGDAPGALGLMDPDIEWITMWHYKVEGRGPGPVAEGLFKPLMAERPIWPQPECPASHHGYRSRQSATHQSGHPAAMPGGLADSGTAGLEIGDRGSQTFGCATLPKSFVGQDRDDTALPLSDGQAASHLSRQIEGPFKRALAGRGYRDDAGAVSAAQPALREAGPA